MTKETIVKAVEEFNAKIAKATSEFTDFDRIAKKYGVDLEIIEVGYLEKVDNNFFRIYNNNMEEVEPGFLAFTDSHVLINIINMDGELESYVEPFDNVENIKIEECIDGSTAVICIAFEFSDCSDVWII